MKTREVLREIKGGCLFIDEAYQLNPARGGPYMTEAVDELVGALTDEEFKGKVLVILAGYDQDMEDMLQTNPGLKSRFSERVHFHDFDADATVLLLTMDLEKKGVPLECSDMRQLLQLAQKLVNSDGFGNGRDVVTWSDRVYREVAKSTNKTSRVRPGSLTSTLVHVERALGTILESRTIRSGGPSCVTAPAKDMLMQNKVAPPPPKVKQDIRVELAEKTCEDAPEEAEPEIEQAEANLFDSVDKKLLSRLQTFLDERGLNDEEGVGKLAKLDPNSSEFAQLVERLHQETGMTLDEAKEQLIKWQSAQEELQEKLLELKKQVVGARPLWRCAVCGRADKPWIVCYVAPYICGYEHVVE
jgi:hypothetical protein